ncbi:MAG TPA: tRNA epoxyqueuosine(34) reductase QueG [Candidatus Limnocylindria bacterium]|nr:tRNA epoxyqueuosine(34) reductase QueG [Candidatus Limnocylindria bacterium]
MTLLALALREAIKARALALGFDHVAVGPAGAPEHGEAFERWLDAGYAGQMDYLARGRAARLDPAKLLPGCRSVIAVALQYAPASADDEARPVARYARGRDYHDVMRPRLHRLRDFITEAAGAGVKSRASLDTSAVLERDLAAAAGLGWIGKNTNLLIPTLGSYFFIGLVLTTAALEADERVPDRCGTCTACLDACPTNAFAAPYVLDARRCISYLTIEHRGAIDEGLRASLDGWAFGCDVCQEVCPWNRKAPASREPAFAAPSAIDDLADVLGLDTDAFRARFRGTAIRRAGRSGLLRNAALLLGGRAGDPREQAALAAATEDPDPVIRDAAEWALARSRSSS